VRRQIAACLQQLGWVILGVGLLVASERGSTPWDVTPHPSPAEPALNSGSPGGQRGPTPRDETTPQRAAVAAEVQRAKEGKPVDYAALLGSFPASLNPSKRLLPAIHNVEHFIETIFFDN